jgi:hypothetical protein
MNGRRAGETRKSVGIAFTAIRPLERMLLRGALARYAPTVPTRKRASV